MNFKGGQVRSELMVGGRPYSFFSLAAVEQASSRPVSRLPFCLKVLLENVVRQQATGQGCPDDVGTLLEFLQQGHGGGEIRFRPERVMMDDTAGLPLLGDLAAMRDALARRGVDPQRVDPVIPVDFVVDHSIIAEHSAGPEALAKNAALEFKRNEERFAFLRWAEQAFGLLRVVPPGGGICHQINLEHLAQVVRRREVDDGFWLVPDTMVGIDSHTPMINSLGIVGWGVSGIEGVSAALGEPVSIRVPAVVGVRLTGRLRPEVTATDLVLTLTQIIRRRDLVGTFVEYCGPGLDHLSLPERATVANMTPECGTTMSFFPIDTETLRYLRLTGRDTEHVALVEAYARAQGLWHDAATSDPRYSDSFDFDLASVEPSMAGPGQPHYRVALSEAPQAFATACRGAPVGKPARDGNALVRDGDVVIAAVTSCTNTSNPSGMIGAGLLARNAVARGLKRKPWVKTSLSPGSRVVADYLNAAGLQRSLDTLGFHVSGFGCMTCVGFSGPLAEPIASAVRDGELATVAVISGNRNYDGRVHPMVRATFLASPPLVVAYALAGTILGDLTRNPIGEDGQGRPVYLSEIWPDAAEIERIIDSTIDTSLFSRSYAKLYEGSDRWRRLAFAIGQLFSWNTKSTFIRCPPDFDDMYAEQVALGDIRDARILAVFGDMVTTEHVSPMGPLPANSFAADYLRSIGVSDRDLGTYAARRLIAEVMIRGTFSSPHLANAMTPGMPGGHTLHQPEGVRMAIFEAARRYREQGIPLVVVAGRQYGTGSSRDWSAKGPRLLGVKAVIAESFERLHRANLVAAGVLPLRWVDGGLRHSFTGAETLDIEGLADLHQPHTELTCRVYSLGGAVRNLRLVTCLETEQEVKHYRSGGTLRYLLQRRAAQSTTAEVYH
ncbi:MAG: aconitate hydratase AcnA [Betaproteobacteria bacterium]|nr:aconitate hydratase AcnA [Betaproteobacteria bacterium]